MIFAHGPFGYLCVVCARRIPALRRIVRRASSHSRRFSILLLIAGFIGGIFPDIDIVYTSLVDASRTHRLLITHTPFLYIGFFLVVLSVFAAWHRRTPILVVGSFVLGALSHIASDAIGGKAMFFFPFFSDFWGLVDLDITFLTANLLLFNFFIEGIFIAIFFLLLIAHSSLRPTWKKKLVALDAFCFTVGVVVLLIANTHIYHAPADMILGDNDHDELLNVNDHDMDGDGVDNINDSDANNNGIANIDEIAIAAKRFEGVWQDPTNGGLLGVPLFHGFITRDDTPRRLLQTVGISLRVVMQEDFARNPIGYNTKPTHGTFDRDMQNIRAWLRHRSALVPLTKRNDRFQPGDLLFFSSGHFALVTQGEESDDLMILDVHPKRRAQERLFTDVSAIEGAVVEVGMIMQAGE